MAEITFEEAEKSIDKVAIRRSVIDMPPEPSSSAPVSQGQGSQIFWFLGNAADSIPTWGAGWKNRDMELRNFIMREPIFASALNIICARNSGFSWSLDGPPRSVNKMQDILENANQGMGWDNLIVQTSIDLYTQDNGAFWELVRAENKQDSPVIGVNHLDAAQCEHTGNAFAPVIYTDRVGKRHLLDWWNVITLSEMPTPIEKWRGMQYCALTRMLISARIQRNLLTLEEEKTAGRETRAIHMVKGVTSQQLQDAMNDARAKADSAGLLRWAAPVIVGTIDPTADVGHDTIEMAGWKPSYDEKLNFDHYMNLIAMAFASDYQDFAPLPGGGLGTGAQSEMLHLKSRGKGPGRFMKLITHAINFRIAPQNLEFIWTEQDLEAQKMIAEVKAIRAQTRATRIASGEIDIWAADQIAQDEGDLDPELLEYLVGRDIDTDLLVNDNSPAETQAKTDGNPGNVRRPDPNRLAARQPNPTAARPRQTQQNPR